MALVLVSDRCQFVVGVLILHRGTRRFGIDLHESLVESTMFKYRFRP